MAIKPYEAGSRAGGGLTGMMILKPATKMKLWRASYGKGTTIIRPWGNTYEADGGEIKMEPHRDSDGYFGTSFFIQDAVCEGWGKDSRVTFMTRVEDEDNWPAGSPADVFYNDISGHPDFKWLTDRPGAKDFPALSQPSVNGFLKGLLLECGGKDYKANPIWGCVLRLSKSAKEAFEVILDATNPEPATNNDPNDPNGWNQKYSVGDPIGFKDGKVFEFDKESKFAAANAPTADINLDGRGGDGSKGGGSGNVIEKYACRVWPNRPKLEIPADKMHKANESFDDAIRYMTGEEQINQVIIPGFGRSCKEAVIYVFGGKDILPATFEFGRTIHDMGAGGASAPGGSATSASSPTTSQESTPSQPEQQEATGPAINMNGPSSEPAEGGEEAPFTPDPSVQVEVAATVPVVPAGEAAAAPVSSTAGDLRSRLDAASNQQG